MAYDFSAVKNEIITNIETIATETAKNELMGWFKGTALPYAEEVADAYVKTLKDQAATESGWCKMRDGIVLPTLISVAEFAVEKTLGALEAAVKADEAKAAEAPADKPAEAAAPAEQVTIA